ncbi:MAG: hypothetical protein K2J54_05050, partial [Clostridia bacterium]|nr:hypothetical protein [Clostridia bacterium]
PFDEYACRVWNAENHRFEAGGVYDVSINTDSLRALYSAQVEITRDNLPEGCEYAENADCTGGGLSYKEYFNRRISPDECAYKPCKGMKATLDTVVADLVYCKGLVAKIFGTIARISKRSKDKIRSVALDWLSVRSLLQFMNLNDVQAEGFLMTCNGHFFKGLKKLLFKN